MQSREEHLDLAWWPLKIALGVGPIITGIDKYFDKLADWGMYLSPLVTDTLHIQAATFMHIVGAVEIFAGIIVLSRWTRIGAYIVMAWLLGIAGNLLTTGMFHDLVMRDIEIAVGAFALAQLTSARSKRNVEKEQAEASSAAVAGSR